MYNILIVAGFGLSALFFVAGSGNPSCGPQDLSSGNSSSLPSEVSCEGGRCGRVAGQICNFNSSSVDAGRTLKRQKRRTTCKKWREWQCAEGTCIPLFVKCDGVVDCPDGSDETHAVCKDVVCQENLFRCAYGACVDGSALCNGIQDCADGSDELLPRCRNETTPAGQEFRCDNGQVISAASLCDGVGDCSDLSDETLAACANMRCPDYYFQCAYGACVDHGAGCDGKIDCVDGSDEDNMFCNRTTTNVPLRITQKPQIEQPTIVQPLAIATDNSPASCTLPPYPEHGTYTGQRQSISPGARISSGHISFSCDEGYRLIGDKNVFCFAGKWLSKFPTCGRFCKMIEKKNIEFRCVLTGDSQGTRRCEDYEPVGMQVKHTCANNYRADVGDIGYMVCTQDDWVNVPRCLPDCGTVTPFGVPMIIGGRMARNGELPWHTGIYSKFTSQRTGKLRHMQICGGSLISSTMVLSAAHCFWGDEKVQPAKNYAVALGKLYRNWNNLEKGVQKSDVKEIYISPQFMGSGNQFQADIAMLLLSSVIQYEPQIRPVCLDFNHAFAKEQLHAGNMGKVAGWGLVSVDGGASKTLKVVELPYVDPGVCKEESAEEFKPFITVDKFCAGYENGTALCRGDSGGGLVFPRRGTVRYFLRGIVSTAHHTDDACDSKSLTTFTNVLMYEDFIKEHWHVDDS